MATIIVIAALRLIGFMEWKLPWKQYVLLYEVRSRDQEMMFSEILHVLDSSGIRMSVIEKETFGTIQRVTFAVNTNHHKHQQLLLQLRTSDKTDEVMAFRDTEQE